MVFLEAVPQGSSGNTGEGKSPPYQIRTASESAGAMSRGVDLICQSMSSRTNRQRFRASYLFHM